MSLPVQKEARAWIEATDAQVRDIPVFEYAIWLQDKIFAIADDLGIGDEARVLVYGIRSLEYATGVAGALVGPGTAAAAGGAGALTVAGGVAALGAVAVVVGVVAWLTGGESDEEYAARKRAQASVLHLRDRLTLHDFAAEQDGFAAGWTMAIGALPGAAAHAIRAAKLATFYRRASAELTPAERITFESIANLSRWQGAILQHDKLPKAKRDALDVQFGKSEPGLAWQLKTPIQHEQSELTKQLLAVRILHLAPRTPKSPWGKAGLIAATSSTQARVARARASKALGAVAALALVLGGGYYLSKRGI